MKNWVCNNFDILCYPCFFNDLGISTYLLVQNILFYVLPSFLFLFLCALFTRCRDGKRSVWNNLRLFGKKELNFSLSEEKVSRELLLALCPKVVYHARRTICYTYVPSPETLSVIQKKIHSANFFCVLHRMLFIFTRMINPVSVGLRISPFFHVSMKFWSRVCSLSCLLEPRMLNKNFRIWTMYLVVQGWEVLSQEQWDKLWKERTDQFTNRTASK